MNTSLQLRSAQEQDLPRLMLLLGQVLAVHHQGRPDLFRPTGSKYSPQQLRQLLTRKDRPIYVAADADGQVLGYAFCMLQETRDDTVLLDRRTLYLDDLCVDEACRGQGVGSALLEYVRQQAVALNCASVTLNVWSCNPTAQAFYAAKGFLPLKTGMEFIL